MSRNCFKEILRFLRFDNKNERSQRLGVDKFALASKIWYAFIENSQNCYNPDKYITVDEQLFPTKSRCRFTQYMPNKPDKFGIKFWLASDVKSKYVINGFPYLGKDETRQPSVPLGEYVVLKLIEPFTGSGRSVTTDNFFTSSTLATKLLQKNTSLVGTIRQNRRELPRSVKIKKDKMERFSVQIYATNNLTLTVYKSKPNKKVLLLSSLHKSVQVENNNKRLPETIKFYNSTKFGVDMTDQMARKYSVKCKCRRWPMHVFFNILDLIGINAWILYKETTGENISRRDFLFQLGEELSTAYKECNERTTNTAVSSAVSCKIGSFPKRGKKCQVKYCSGNRATTICSQCKKYSCGKCLKDQPIICKKCCIE